MILKVCELQSPPLRLSGAYMVQNGASLSRWAGKATKTTPPFTNQTISEFAHGALSVETRFDAKPLLNFQIDEFKQVHMKSEANVEFESATYLHSNRQSIDVFRNDQAMAFGD